MQPNEWQTQQLYHYYFKWQAYETSASLLWGVRVANLNSVTTVAAFPISSYLFGCLPQSSNILSVITLQKGSFFLFSMEANKKQMNANLCMPPDQLLLLCWVFRLEETIC